MRIAEKWFGFWKEETKYENAPSVKEYLRNDWWSAREFEACLQYLSEGWVISVRSAVGETCWICSGPMERSYAYMTDGSWLWDNFLVHYISAHKIAILCEFYEHIVNNAFKIPEVSSISCSDDNGWPSLDWPTLRK